MLAVGSKERLAVGLIGVFVVILLIHVGMIWLYAPLALPSTVGAATCIIIYFMRRWQIKPPLYDKELRRLLALADLSHLLGDTFLPFGSMAMEPEVLLPILTHMQANHHRVIVECGSGVSTLMIGKLLRQSGKGHLYSLEDDENWHHLMVRLVAEHDLTQYVSLIHAPLEARAIDGTESMWYASSKVQEVLQAVEHIDLLIVDGPRSVDEFSRYPALPVFSPVLTADTLIVLHDASRSYEQEVLARWERVFPITVESSNSGERGMALIRLRTQAQPQTDIVSPVTTEL